MTKKEKFYQIYANLPLNLRNEIVAVIKDEPITWRVAKLEIDGSTKIGDLILDKLNSMQII